MCLKTLNPKTYSPSVARHTASRPLQQGIMNHAEHNPTLNPNSLDKVNSCYPTNF